MAIMVDIIVARERSGKGPCGPTSPKRNAQDFPAAGVEGEDCLRRGESDPSGVLRVVRRCETCPDPTARCPANVVRIECVQAVLGVDSEMRRAARVGR